MALVAAACSDGGPASADPGGSAAGDEAAGDEGAGGAGGDTSAPGEEMAFPGGQWATTSPADAGIDEALLEEMIATAEAKGSNCLLVQRRGKVVGEWYWNGTTADSAQEVFSASKSVTSVLVGMAHDDGDLEVDDPASEYIPAWQGTPSETVTVEDLLSNDSGRHYDPVTDYVEMAAKADDKTAFSIGLGQDAPPDEVWKYNNSAIQTLSAVFAAATGEDMADFAQERLLGPLGMSDSRLTRDRAGNPLAFMGVQSTCRDMARFGHLMLNDGTWAGERVLSEAWVRDSTGAPSQDLNSAYGWLWWLNRPGPQLGDEQALGDAAGDDTRIGQMVPDAPQDTFFALGLGGQVVAVDPGSQTVVVRLGPSGYPPGTPRYEPGDAAVLATRLAAGD